MEQSSQPSYHQTNLNNPYPSFVAEVSDHVLHSNNKVSFKEVEDFKERNGLMLNVLESLTSMKDSLSRVIEELLEEENDENFLKEDEGKRVSVESELSEESRVLLEETSLISRLAIEVETRVNKYKEMRRKEKRELENSLISLTEENRDTNNLLRVALLEKEALEKRVKGHDHKRMPLLQFAELGLQKVGFGFMMGGSISNIEQSTDTNSESNKSDSSECEEEVVSLVSS